MPVTLGWTLLLLQLEQGKIKLLHFFSTIKRMTQYGSGLLLVKDEREFLFFEPIILALFHCNPSGKT